MFLFMGIIQGKIILKNVGQRCFNSNQERFILDIVCYWDIFEYSFCCFEYKGVSWLMSIFFRVIIYIFFEDFKIYFVVYNYLLGKECQKYYVWGGFLSGVVFGWLFKSLLIGV